MRNVRIDATAAYRLVEMVVAEKGADHRYPMGGQCEYFSYGGAACLIGHVIDCLDPEAMEKFLDFEGYDEYPNDGADVGDLMRYYFPETEFTFSTEAVRFLSMAQSIQDSTVFIRPGVRLHPTWGDVLDRTSKDFNLRSGDNSPDYDPEEEEDSE